MSTVSLTAALADEQSLPETRFTIRSWLTADYAAKTKLAVTKLCFAVSARQMGKRRK